MIEVAECHKDAGVTLFLPHKLKTSFAAPTKSV